MKALIAGFGGIGANVYYPELKLLGYSVDILDSTVPNVTYRNVAEVSTGYDIAVVCTPNFTHEEIARSLASHGTKRIFIEKPGVRDSWEWGDLVNDFEDTSFHMVKNNLYRGSYGNIFELMKEKKVIGVDIAWLNANRIPNPGSWFTNRSLAFGGVSRDLMPHLYCFGAKIFGHRVMEQTYWTHTSMQRWDLAKIKTSDYGVVNSQGKYNVDDYSSAIGEIGNITVRMTASWKEGYDKQSITLFFDDGTTYEWSFGLCPAEAYGMMLADSVGVPEMDTAIHNFLDNFNGY
jgi:oxidoreductase